MLHAAGFTYGGGSGDGGGRDSRIGWQGPAELRPRSAREREEGGVCVKDISLYVIAFQEFFNHQYLKYFLKKVLSFSVHILSQSHFIMASNRSPIRRLLHQMKK